jgi:hypothetical protein
MPEECGPIEFRIELPSGAKLTNELIRKELIRAAEDPAFVQQVQDFFAVSQNQAAVATVVRQIPPPPPGGKEILK